MIKEIKKLQKRINGFGICTGLAPYEEEEESHKEFW